MMTFNSKWPRWVKASIYKHFDTNKGSLDLFVEGQERPDIQEWAELRLNGPIFEEASKDVWSIVVDINVLIGTNLAKDIYLQDKAIGIVSSIFVTNLPVYEYGDSGNQFGCLILVDHIKTIQYGQINPDTKLLYATVEGQYRILL